MIPDRGDTGVASYLHHTDSLVQGIKLPNIYAGEKAV